MDKYERRIRKLSDNDEIISQAQAADAEIRGLSYDVFKARKDLTETLIRNQKLSVESGKWISVFVGATLTIYVIVMIYFGSFD